MTYVIRPDYSIHPIDVPALALSLATRRAPAAGDECRAERDELAALLGDGPLADLLRSGRPIRVRSGRADQWQVIEA